MEEALVVHSLFHEDTLSQIEIATLLGRHKKWGCRRIALIDRLGDEGRDQIKRGLLPISMSGELIKLPPGNQKARIDYYQAMIRIMEVKGSLTSWNMRC